MKNKLKLKKYLLFTIIVVTILWLLFLGIYLYEYRIYTSNFNQKINSIISKVRGKYPNVTDDEIIEIFNYSDEVDDSFFKSYGIDIYKEAILLENDKFYHQSVIFNSLFFIGSIVVIVCLFLKYNYHKDMELKDITRYIEEINRGNYYLDIDGMSEDELSILKNEIYKTTVMLKEAANNSLKDKRELKKSLEDISHQLKTPLTSILVMLDNIIDNPDMDNDIREEFIRDIKRDVSNIIFLVQSLLKLSKFDANTIHFIQEKTQLEKIISTSIKNVSNLADLKDVTIKKKISAKGRITCDFMWQVEAFTNIIKNAVEHSKEHGEVLIEISENRLYAEVKISNFGFGIASDDLPHIFERFYKGKNASSDSVGIGLALAKTIIEHDNGEITVLSTPNEMTTFRVRYFYGLYLEK